MTRAAGFPARPAVHPMRLGLFLLSAATLAFEINLTRLFSVSQFYHFAFLIVSVALLGFGASGMILAIFPSLGQKNLPRSLSRLALAAALSILGAYLLINWLPFDSFSIAWDRRQVFILVLHYLTLATPFFFSGMAVGLLLSAYPQAVGSTYATNLMGSALGCIVALVAPTYLGGEGTVILSCGLAASAAIPTLIKHLGIDHHRRKPLMPLVILALLLLTTADLGLRLSDRTTFSFLDLKISPYKSLSYTLQYPGAEVIYRRWNSFSRVDLVRSQGIRSLPGLSYRYLEPPPPEDGLLVDGDELSPILLPGAEPAFHPYLPAAVAFELKPQANTLVLEPRGGLDLETARSLGAQRVTAVEVNPLIIEASEHIYNRSQLRVFIQSDRSYLRSTSEKFDVVILSLANSYHPVRSGAYSLAEDYRYTVESFQDALSRLELGGLLVVTRWLQYPPSESLRAFALAVTALENTGADPKGQIVAFRGYNTVTLLVKASPFTPLELQTIRHFTTANAFDLVYAPDIDPQETNQHNILPHPVYYQSFIELLETQPRQIFYDAYPYEITPPTDDRPFFGHYFKWSQTEQVLAELGKTWQPFGGAGYFVIVALLILSSVLAGALILLPVAISQFWPWSRHSKTSSQTRSSHGHNTRYLVYFALIGFAFLLVEIPLIQRFILYLGHPSYALTAVLFAILLFSGLGSKMSKRIKLLWALGLLTLLLLLFPILLPHLFEHTLGLPISLKLGLTVLVLAPLGFLMGTAFPGGINWMLSDGKSPRRNNSSGKFSQGNFLHRDTTALIPWIWGVNGAASVVASILAALLALSFGFSWVFRLGALCYAGAYLTVWLYRQTS